MGQVRAKFVVTSVTYSQHWQGKSKRIGQVNMSAVSDGSEENKRFFDATPSGEIKLSTLNQSAIDALPLGAEVYVDFTLVPKA